MIPETHQIKIETDDIRTSVYEALRLLETPDRAAFIISTLMAVDPDEIDLLCHIQEHWDPTDPINQYTMKSANLLRDTLRNFQTSFNKLRKEGRDVLKANG